MKSERCFYFLLPVIALYGVLFWKNIAAEQRTFANLQPMPDHRFVRIISGYFRQIVAEIFFVQSSVFLGGVQAGTDPRSYSSTIAHNYRQITNLYPEFRDPYYYAQSYLADVGREEAAAVNAILDSGLKASPKDLLYPFLKGYNLFRYLDSPLEAAEVFRKASHLPDAPPMFSHLAVILAAEGGEIEAAMLSLVVLIKSSTEIAVQRLYQEELEMFYDARRVQQAVNEYHHQHQKYPTQLSDLVPQYLTVLPSFGTKFTMTWNPPIVGLKRPKR